MKATLPADRIEVAPEVFWNFPARHAIEDHFESAHGKHWLWGRRKDTGAYYIYDAPGAAHSSREVSLEALTA